MSKIASKLASTAAVSGIGRATVRRIAAVGTCLLGRRTRFPSAHSAAAAAGSLSIPCGAFMSTSTAASVANPAKSPTVTVNDDHLTLALPGSGSSTHSIFHHVWLRDNCPCPACIHPSTRQKLHSSGDIPTDIQPIRVQWVRADPAAAANTSTAPKPKPKAKAESHMFAHTDGADPWILEVEWPAFAFPSRGEQAGNDHAKADAAVLGDAEPHVSRYSASFLRRWNYSSSSSSSCAGVGPSYLYPDPQPWSGAEIDAQGHLHVDYKSLPPIEQLLPAAASSSDSTPPTSSIADRTRHLTLPPVTSLPPRILDRFATHGLVFFHNVPTNRGNDYIETLAKRFGHQLRWTFYGPSWDVKSVPQSTNIAYTNLFLGLHMDLMYFEAPPGLQFLHMLRTNVKGGSSLFLDMLHTWRSFVQAHPRDVWHPLTSVPTAFHYAHAHHAPGDGPHWLARQHALSTDKDGSQMYYAPPFQGPLMPLSGDSSWASDPHVVKAWYKGMRAWDEHVRRQQMVMIDLKPGDAVLFHNRRVLHGRTAFDAVQDGVGAGDKAVRHLRGCYVDWDEFLDRWRVSRYREMELNVV